MNKTLRSALPAILSLITICVIGSIISSCTENSKAKTFGGTGRLTLPAGQKLITATWKDDDFRYLTRPMRAGEYREVYSFKEESSFGVLNGTYIIYEVAADSATK